MTFAEIDHGYAKGNVPANTEQTIAVVAILGHKVHMPRNTVSQKMETTLLGASLLYLINCIIMLPNLFFAYKNYIIV